MKKFILILFSCIFFMVSIFVVHAYLYKPTKNRIQTLDHALAVLTGVYVAAYFYEGEMEHFPLTEVEIKKDYNIAVDYTYESDGQTFLASVEYKGNKIYIDQKGMAFDHQMRLLPDRNRRGTDPKDMIEQLRRKSN